MDSTRSRKRAYRPGNGAPGGAWQIEDMSHAVRAVRICRIALAIAFFALLGAIVWGHTLEPFYFAGLTRILATQWGILMTADFVVSLVLIAIWIGFLERSLARGLAWG